MVLHAILSLLSVALVHVQLANSQCSTLPPVAVSGRVLCDGQSPPPVDVILVQQIGILRNEIGRVHSDTNGGFQISGFPLYTLEQLPDFLITVQYHEYRSGEKVSLRLGNSDFFHNISTTAGDTKINAGNLPLRSHRCRGYATFYNALEDYYDRVGKRIPKKTFVHIDSITVSDGPYVDYDSVISTKDFEWNLTLAKHEIAHVVRHVLDGSKAHFNLDREAFGAPGLRYHNCSSETSEGFAFNEGWAFFWAGECLESDENGPYKIGGNVAAALRRIQKLCGTSDADMVLVLEVNPAVIHSYSEFEEKHSELHQCP